jgi:hypothetical protein
MVFMEEFNDNTLQWPTKKGKNTSFSIKNGYYYIECLKKRKAALALCQLDIDENEKFEIEASIRKESMTKKSGYGIVFGFSDANNHYGFLINDEGEFRFFERNDGEKELIIPWTESEYINRGIGTSNKLMIKNEEDRLVFYINDSIVSHSPVQKFFGNMAGLYVQKKQRIAVDYFSVVFSPTPKYKVTEE